MTERPCDDCPGCGELEAHPDQPFGIEIHTSDGVFVKEMRIPKAGTYVPQHAHKYDHLSMLAVGSVKAWADGVYLGVFNAPHGFDIPQRVKHMFLSLKDNTVIYCIHRLRKEEVEIHEEHNIVRSH